MRTFVLFFLVALFVFDASAGVKDWSVYKTENFTFYSDQDEAGVKKSLEELEVFRLALLGLLQLDSSKPLLPVQIYSFKSQNDFRDVSPRKLGGFFRNTQTGPIMVIGPGDGGQVSYEILYHEYVHYLMRSIYSANFPTWYDEGIADFYSTLDIGQETIVVGREPKGRARRSGNDNLVNLEKLMLETNQSKSRAASFERSFYSTSWLLVHFLSLGSVNGFDDYRTAMFNFLGLQNKGLSAQEAFKQAFPISVQELERQLKRYNRKRHLNAYKIPKPKVELRYTSSKLSLADTYATLSKLAFDSGKKEIADEYLELALDHKSALAFSIHSFLAARKNDKVEAQKFIQLALDNKSIFAETYLNIAQAYITLAKNDANVKSEMNHLALSYLEKAKESGTMPRASIYLAELYWQQGKKQQAVDEILSLVKLTPADLRANYIAGEYMLRIKNQQFAEFFFGNVINWSHSEALAQQARDMLNAIAK